MKPSHGSPFRYFHGSTAAPCGLHSCPGMLLRLNVIRSVVVLVAGDEIELERMALRRVAVYSTLWLPYSTAETVDWTWYEATRQ